MTGTLPPYTRSISVIVIGLVFLTLLMLLESTTQYGISRLFPQGPISNDGELSTLAVDSDDKHGMLSNGNDESGALSSESDGDDEDDEDLPSVETIDTKPIEVDNAFLKQHPQETPITLDINEDTVNPNCYVNIYGLPRSGTGLLQLLSIKSVGMDKSSWFQNTHTPEDEGYHLTKSIPFSLYNPKCAVDPDNDRVAPLNSTECFVCPHLMPQYTPCPRFVRKKLLNDWDRFWNQSQVFLFQKSPNMKMWMLDSCLPTNRTVHIISIRHPIFWRYEKARKGKCAELKVPFRICMTMYWMQIWKMVFERNFYDIDPAKLFVVRFETLVHNPSIIDFIPRTCNNQLKKPSAYFGNMHGSASLQGQREEIDSTSNIADPEGPRLAGRRLILKEGGEIDEDLTWKSAESAWWKKCLEYPQCRTCLEAGEAGARILGYSLLSPSIPMISNETNFLHVMNGPSLIDQKEIVNALAVSDKNMAIRCVNLLDLPLPK
jgi:hypothetical protein